jgi:hypothetical protein
LFFIAVFIAVFRVRLQLLLANSWQDDKKWQPNFGISAALG